MRRMLKYFYLLNISAEVESPIDGWSTVKQVPDIDNITDTLQLGKLDIYVFTVPKITQTRFVLNFLLY